MIGVVTPATAEDIELVAGNIREADREELWLAYAQSPSAVLSSAIKLSDEAWTGRIDGVPICMFGVASTSALTPDIGCPWMVSTAAMDDPAYARLFLRRCRPHLQRMLSRYKVLINYCHASNERAIDWLTWLGFRFSPPTDIGPFLRPFVRFELRRDDQTCNQHRHT